MARNTIFTVGVSDPSVRKRVNIVAAQLTIEERRRVTAGEAFEIMLARIELQLGLGSPIAQPRSIFQA